MTVTVRDAVASLNDGRKAAAGAVDPHAFARQRRDADPTLENTPAYLAGLDLDPEELRELGEAHGHVFAQLTFTRGPITAGSTVWTDGLITGLELARLRRQEEGVDGRAKALRGALEAVRRILDDEPGPLDDRVLRACAVVDVMLEGDDEDA